MMILIDFSEGFDVDLDGNFRWELYCWDLRLAIRFCFAVFEIVIY